MTDGNMSGSEQISPKLSAADVLAMSDEKLGQFMQKYRNRDGDLHLPVDGWGKPSPGELNRLAERLKAQQRSFSAKDPTSYSDFEQLDARLQQLSDGGVKDQRRMQERTTPPDTEEDHLRYLKDSETKAWKQLIKDGGRPPFPINMVEEILRKPQQYCDLLWPFRGGSLRDSTASPLVFDLQLKRWQNFRKWQLDNRGLKDNDEGFPAYLEKMRSLYIRNGRTCELDELEADPSKGLSTWLELQRMREYQRQYYQEPGCKTFSQYAIAVRRRLARHGFKQPVELRAHPGSQDRLTTWIEYLGFECWWLDRSVDAIERLKPHQDRCWQDLVDMKIPRLYETPETIRTPASSMRRAREEKDAEDVASKMWNGIASRGGEYDLIPDNPYWVPEWERTIYFKPTPEERERLEAAEERARFIRTENSMINKFIRETESYEKAERDALYQAAFVQWVRQQVPKIRDELTPPKRTKASFGTKDGKRKRTPDEDEPEEGSSKKRNTSHEEAPAVRAESN
ncbi:hypothetical protein CP532_6613 [Ophiocordyceps camponoti-leonardi (nom. inval.)]|nr:hypothetical protein CP532_6613 [Ophiocordyceps camponoti-leonardi (nom. inval.)]